MWGTQDFISNLLRMISIKFMKWLHLTDMAIMTIPDSLYNVRRLIKLDRSDLFTFVGRVYLLPYLVNNAHQYWCTFFEDEAEAYVAKICASYSQG